MTLQQPGPTFIFSGAPSRNRDATQPDHISEIRVAFDGDRFIEQRQSLQRVDGFPFPNVTVYVGRVGHGNFRFVNGEPAEMDAETLVTIQRSSTASPTVLHVSAAARGQSWSVFGTTNTPVLLFIKASARPGKAVIEHDYRKDGEWHLFRTLNHTGDEFVDAMTLQPDAPTTSPIYVDLFWHEEFKVEMIVKPPRANYSRQSNNASRKAARKHACEPGPHGVRIDRRSRKLVQRLKDSRDIACMECSPQSKSRRQRS